MTFLPLGSIALRVNLFSAVAGCLSLVLLYGLTHKFLKFVFEGQEAKASVLAGAALIPAGLLAFCDPFWWHCLVAEVYTLHALLTMAMIYGLLEWRMKKDVRYLYATAFLYGLSAGNHATVAFYLPALLILLFAWARERVWRHLGLCAALFLVGFSIYAYLPIRSATEPSFDWGNPETAQGFMFQVTDRKDAHTHFQELRQNPVTGVANPGGSSISDGMGGVVVVLKKTRNILTTFIRDLWHHYHPLVAIGFLVGLLFCGRKSVPFCVFLLVIVGGNISFFTSWGAESFFPSYIVAALFTASALFFLLDRLARLENPAQGEVSGTDIRWHRITALILSLAIPWLALKNYPGVDRSRDYLAESMTRKVYLDLEDRSLFIPGLSWFRYYYEKDVSRLRDDVIAVALWDLLLPYPPAMLTSRRYPDLHLPETAGFQFNTSEGVARYAQAFLEKNVEDRPILLEQSRTFYEQSLSTDNFKPFRHVLLKYSSDSHSPVEKAEGDRVFSELEALLQADLDTPGSGRDFNWLSVPTFWVKSIQTYFHETGQWDNERRALTLQNRFLGWSDPVWQFQWIDNLVRSGQRDQAELSLKVLEEKFPDDFHTLLARGVWHRSGGQAAQALPFLQLAVQRAPESFRSRLELYLAYRSLGDFPNADRALKQAQAAVTEVRQLSWLRAETGAEAGARPGT